jgi:hypothetical protein
MSASSDTICGHEGHRRTSELGGPYRGVGEIGRWAWWANLSMRRRRPVDAFPRLSAATCHGTGA